MQDACCLVMQLIPGRSLLSIGAPFNHRNIQRTAADLGRYALMPGSHLQIPVPCLHNHHPPREARQHADQTCPASASPAAQDGAAAAALWPASSLCRLCPGHLAVLRLCCLLHRLLLLLSKILGSQISGVTTPNDQLYFQALWVLTMLSRVPAAQAAGAGHDPGQPECGEHSKSVRLYFQGALLGPDHAEQMGQIEKVRLNGCLLHRLLVLDMILGNQDRLGLEALGWRGNPHNMMFANRGEFQNRTVAIDSLVQRRPPGRQWREAHTAFMAWDGLIDRMTDISTMMALGLMVVPARISCSGSHACGCIFSVQGHGLSPRSRHAHGIVLPPA